jgi:tRNA threonylcarbamoyladenosine biosynthesis protein TsaB
LLVIQTVVLIMAIETTSTMGSLALLRDREVIGERPLDAGRYSTQLHEALNSLASDHGFKLRDVEGFAVANGPGSFTGVRVGLTTVKGLVEVWQTPAIAVSTLAAMASMHSLEAPLLVAMDASRDEVYWGCYPSGALQFAQSGVSAGEEGLERRSLFLERALASRFRLLVVPEALSTLESVPHATLVVADHLARGVGILGGELLCSGSRCDALALDANYIRRSDAELFSLPRLRRS